MTRPLVSADDVRDARKRRETRLTIPAAAIVTPLARDEAARWGIELVEETAGVGGSRPGGGSAGPGRSGATGRSPATGSPARPVPHVPTCDDPGDPVERIVARVMAQVPGADPAQVREIARRVLGSP